jgi:N-acetylglucosamine-6-phosphate deacetylase
MHKEPINSLTGHCLLPDGRFHHATLKIQDGRIAQVVSHAPRPGEPGLPGFIVPGWIDLQINGGFGHDFTIQPERVRDVSLKLPAYGVTGFLPTLITSEFSSYPRRLETIQTILQEQQQSPVRDSARVLGVHLEGPYLNPLRPGAHPVEYLRPIKTGEVATWANPAIVRLVTLAGELESACDAIRALRGNGISVSLGHSDATYAQARQAFEAGVTWATHLFNAMRPLHHREPGLIGAILESDIPCGMIVDGIHVHPSLVRLAYRLKGRDGIMLVTDAMEALGMPPGRYSLSGKVVLVSGQDARLEDHTLAGSLLSMDQAIRNFIAYTGCDLADAIQMASLNPARFLGMDDRLGQIAEGYQADLVILDEQIRPVMTMVGGEILFQRT